MTSIAIRNRLFEYIRFADEKKIKAIYTIVEEEINEKHDIWTKEFIAEMQKRSYELESGKVKGILCKIFRGKVKYKVSE